MEKFSEQHLSPRLNDCLVNTMVWGPNLALETELGGESTTILRHWVSSSPRRRVTRRAFVAKGPHDEQQT
jgi:hypothetical protein